MEPLVDYIRLLSEHGRLATLPQIAALAGMAEIDETDVAPQYITLIVQPQYQDICMRLSAGAHYFFSSDIMASNYAERYLAVQRGDITSAFAAQVREHSCQHNQIVEASTLHYPPYQLDSEAIARLKQQLNTAAYRDICFALDDTGNGYFYCSSGLTASYANVLANYDPYEWSF